MGDVVDTGGAPEVAETPDVPDEQVEKPAVPDPANHKEENEGEEKPPKKEAAPKAPVEKKKWKVKALDKEIDVDSEDQLVSYARKGLAYDQVGAQFKKDRDELVSILKTLKDPETFWQAAEQLGHKPDDLAIARTKRHLEYEDLREKNPDKLRAMQLEQDLARERGQRERMEAEHAARVKEAKAEEYRQKFSKTFSDAFKAVKLPATTDSLRRMGQLYNAYLGMTGIELSPQDIASQVREEAIKQSHSYVTHPETDDATFAEFVGGDKGLERAAKMWAQKMKRNETAPPEAQPQSNGALKRPPNNKMTFEEYRAKNKLGW